MARAAIKMEWVTCNSRSFVGGPEIGFTLERDQCYQIPEKLARTFAREGWVNIGKERRNRVVVK